MTVLPAEKIDFNSNCLTKRQINSTKNIDSIENVKYLGTDYSYKHEIVWKNVIGFAILHAFALWGLAVALTGGLMLKTIVYTVTFHIVIGSSITMGAHRLFTHRSYEAKPLLRALLIIFHVVAGQNTMFTWCRDHRLHHRYSETDGDPHNSNRGFFFSHIGWLMTKRHPYVIELGKKIDMSDLKNDWMVRFQIKYYVYLYIVFALFLPLVVPVYVYGDDLLNSILFVYFFRYVFMLNGTWLVNSAAHLWGTRPYDKSIQPVESFFVSFITLGEGWHNYHHTFPWDYKCAEKCDIFNISGRVISLFGTFGWTYNLKSVSPGMVYNKILRGGDGTHYKFGNDESNAAVKATGPLHPLNPSYNVTYEPLSASNDADDGDERGVTF